MADPVKPKRPYHSPRRQEQAAATRTAILRAAQRRFETEGYPATTMEAVAAEAGVALKTVYVAFATKSGLLRAVWDLLLKGDEDEAAVAAREWYLEVMAEPDPARQLRLNARNSVVVKRRIAGVLGVIRDAAPGRRRPGRAVGAHPVGLPRQPAHHRRGDRPQGWPAAGPRRRARRRPAVDAEPPRRLAAARRPAALDARRSTSDGWPTPRARSSSVPARQAPARRGQAGRVRVRRRGPSARRTWLRPGSRGPR